MGNSASCRKSVPDTKKRTEKRYGGGIEEDRQAPDLVGVDLLQRARNETTRTKFQLSAMRRRRRNRSRTGSILYRSERSMYVKKYKTSVKQNTRWFFFQGLCRCPETADSSGGRKEEKKEREKTRKGDREMGKEAGQTSDPYPNYPNYPSAGTSAINTFILYPVKAHSQWKAFKSRTRILITSIYYSE